MMTGEKIEDPYSPFELWRVDSKGERIERLAAADARDGLRHVRRRLDWHYQIYHKGKPVPPPTHTS
jgi:hypothetical protein